MCHALQPSTSQAREETILQDVLMSSQYALSVRYQPMGFGCLRRVMIRERGDQSSWQLNHTSVLCNDVQNSWKLQKIDLTCLSMFIRASPIVDTPLSPRVEQLDIQKVYRINKKLRFCSSLVRRVSTNQPAVLVCSLKCCLCINHPEDNTIRSHFCQSFNVIQIFSVLFKVVILMKVRSNCSKLLLAMLRVFHPTICSTESPGGLSSPRGEVESYSPKLISGSISASRKFRPLEMAPSPTLIKPDPRSNSNKR